MRRGLVPKARCAARALGMMAKTARSRDCDRDGMKSVPSRREKAAIGDFMKHCREMVGRPFQET